MVSKGSRHCSPFGCAITGGACVVSLDQDLLDKWGGACVSYNTRLFQWDVCVCDSSSLSSEVPPCACPENHKSNTEFPLSWIRLFVFTLEKSHITSSNYEDVSDIPQPEHMHRSLSAATLHPCWPIKSNWRADCHAVTAGCSCTALNKSLWHLCLFVLLKGSSSRIYSPPPKKRL